MCTACVRVSVRVQARTAVSMVKVLQALQSILDMLQVGRSKGPFYIREKWPAVLWEGPQLQCCPVPRFSMATASEYGPCLLLEHL